MGVRRTHHKSKNGCSQCKFRRIKCNEVGPQCQNCAHRDIACDFAHPAREPSTSLVSETTSPSAVGSPVDGRCDGDGYGGAEDHRAQGNDGVEAVNTDSPSRRGRRGRSGGDDDDDDGVGDSNREGRPQPQHRRSADRAEGMVVATAAPAPFPSHPPPDPYLLSSLPRSRATTELAIADLELLHHFSTVTYATLADACASRDNRELWQVHAVQLGFQHEFLLRAILTVAALHLRDLQPLRSGYYDLLASTHQNFALETARDALTRVDEHNCHAIFTFSCLIVIMTSASLRKQGGVDAHQEILEWFLLLRGCNSVLQLHWETLGHSFLYPLIDEVRQTETKPTHAIKDVDRIMDLLTTCCLGGAMRDPEAAKAYTMTVYELTKTFSQVSILRDRGQGLILSCCIWPNTVPQQYLDLLRAQKAEALVILAHYAVLLHWANDEWFMRGMAGYLLDTIRSSLGGDWHSAVAWPSSVIGSHRVA